MHFTVKVTDSSTPAQSAYQPLTIGSQLEQIWNTTGEAPFGYQYQTYLGESGYVTSVPGTYAYGPSIIYNPVAHDTLMWFCGGTGTNGNGGDGVYFTRSTGFGDTTNGSTWSNPALVIRSSRSTGHYAWLDGWQACDPSVVMADNYYFIAYTGSTNWTQIPGGYRYGQTFCDKVNGQPDDGNCDNRIFLARVPVGSESDKYSYEKLVYVGAVGCSGANCFGWEPFWQNNDQYAPVPIVRNEIGAVWQQQVGSLGVGTTTPQTSGYGIGQPSLMNLGDARIFFTSEFNGVGFNAAQSGNPCAGIGECVWQQPAGDFLSAFDMQNQQSSLGPSWYRRAADFGNDVNYDVAWDSEQSRYVATIARENISEGPRIMYSQTTSQDVSTSNTTAGDTCTGATTSGGGSSGGTNIISCGLDCQAEAQMPNTEPFAHNSGILRDEYGNLIASPGKSDGSGGSFYWVYYADHRNLPSDHWTIVRVPFARQTMTPPSFPNCDPLDRFYNRAIHNVGDHWVTTGLPALPGYDKEMTLGGLPPASQANVTPLYSCQVGGWDQMVSTNPTCEGTTKFGQIGYIYKTPPPALTSHQVYRCYVTATGDHFVSNDPTCEGQHFDYTLGWVLG